MKESAVLKGVHLALARLSVILFRSNTGQGWVGRVTHQTAREITLADPRPLHAGLIKGSSDLIGWQTITITPEMVGKKVAVFTAIEVKGPTARLTADQKNFLEQVNNAGGCAFMARTDQDATGQMVMWREVMGCHEKSGSSGRG